MAVKGSKKPRGLEYGEVPAKRVIEAINKALNIEWPWKFQSGIGVDTSEPSPLEPLTLYWSGDDLKKMISRPHGWIDFDLADKILCTLNLVELWRGPLEDLYLEVSLAD